MKFDWDEILSSKSGGFYLVVGRERDFDTMRENLVDDCDRKAIVRILRGKRCSTKEGLFQEFAAALQFPYYFGENWSAFDDCVRHLSTFSANQYVIVITNFNDVVVEHVRDIKNVLLNLLKDAVTTWGKDNEFRPAKPLHIILHCEVENEYKCKEIIKQENIEVLVRIINQVDKIKKNIL